MPRKLLFALAACPLALAGCGGGTPPSSTASPSGNASGMQTPAAALDAAKSAVDNADSERTEAAVRRARSALSEAVDTAETALAAAQADLKEAEAALKEAQDYSEAQAAILDGLPITAASLSLATVKPASTAAEAAEALTAARNAMAIATSTRTAAAIQRARRALSEAVETADAFLAAARADVRAAQANFRAARDYKAEQDAILNSLPITQPPGTPPPSSPTGEFATTLRVWSSVYTASDRIGGAVVRRSEGIRGDVPGRPLLRDARELANGFSRMAVVNGIPLARKTIVPEPFMPTVDLPLPDDQSSRVEFFRRASVPGNDLIVAISHYSAFQVTKSYIDLSHLDDTMTWPEYVGGHSVAFGERSVRAPNFSTLGVTAVLYRGAMAGVFYRNTPGTLVNTPGTAFAGEATLRYHVTETGDRVFLALREIRDSQDVTGIDWTFSKIVPVNSDGSFADSEIKGDFYGPNWQEAAGIFELENTYGAWLVHSAEQ